MRSQLRLGRVAGIPVGANWSLVVILGLLAYVLATSAEPFDLFAAYGNANVRADPGDPRPPLGIVDATTPALLVSFGLPKHIATLGVLG